MLSDAKRLIDIDYVDKHFVPIERYNQLEKEIEELKEDNKHQWEERCKLTFELENSTSNDKIKAKIEEYEEQEKDEPNAFLCKRVLQSLLEKEGE